MKLANDGKCMEGLRPFSVPFTVFIGSPESDYDWDEKVRTLSAFRENAKFLYKVVPGLAKAGAPIWRMDPATVMDRWQRGLPLLFDRSWSRMTRPCMASGCPFGRTLGSFGARRARATGALARW